MADLIIAVAGAAFLYSIRELSAIVAIDIYIRGCETKGSIQKVGGTYGHYNSKRQRNYVEIESVMRREDMKVSDNDNVRYGQIPGMYEVIPQKDTGNILTKAIKDYKDEYLTGLTEEERSKIDKEIKAYLEQHEIKTEQDRNKLNSFIKSLFKKYGFKGDGEDFIAQMDEEEDEAKPLKSDTTFAYEKSICSGIASKTRLLEW